MKDTGILEGRPSMRGCAATSARLLLIAIVTLGYAAPAPAITAEEFRLRA